MRRLTLLCRLLVGCLCTAALALPSAASPADPSAVTTLAAAAGPSRLSPSSTATGPVPVLSWSPVRGAVRYEVEVSSDPYFATVAYEATTTNVRATPTRTLPAGEMFWRVRGINAAKTPGAWSTATFTVAAVEQPALLMPEDGALLQPPLDVPLLTWDDVASADAYEVVIADEPDFVSPETYTVKTPTLLRRKSQVPGNTYYWRVRALADGQAGLWSETRSWTAGGLQKPEPVYPANSATSKMQDVVLEWTAVPGAVSYDIRISTDEAFTTVVHTNTTISTRYSPSMTLDNDQYWWQVRPRDIYGNFQEWSESDPWQFQRNWPQAPELEWPEYGTTVPAPSFYEWSAIPHASRYQLDVSTDRNFSAGSVRTCYTALTTYTPTYTRANPPTPDPCMPTPGAATYWRVRGIDEPREVKSLWSAAGVFIYASADVQELQPADGAVVDVPSLSWEPAPHAEMYTVYLSRPTGKVTQHETYSTSYTPETKLPAGVYGWQVIAKFEDGTFTQSLRAYPRTFTVSDTTPAATSQTPDPLTPAPAAGHTYRPPALTWKPTVGAAFYRVVVSGPDTHMAYQTLSGDWEYPAATDIADDRLAAGTYYWFVEAFAESGTQPIATGSVATFEIAEPDMVTGHAVSLTGTGFHTLDHTCKAALNAPEGSPKLCANLRATPVLEWAPVRDAAFYELYLSHDRSMTNLVEDYDPVAVTSSRWAPRETLPDSQAGDAFYWAVRPCVSTTACAPEPNWAGHAFDKRSFPASGLQPSTGSQVSGRVTFSWDEYRATNLATPDGATGLLSDQGARQYEIEVSADPTFGTVLEDAIIDQTTYTSRDTTYPDGTFYWRVRALDDSLFPLPWSAVQMVTKTTPAPTPTTPTGASLGSAQVLRWLPEVGAQEYEVEVYENNDLLFSKENLVRRVTSPLAAAPFDVPLPAAAQPYVWRVRQVDAGDEPGQWSAPRTFVVKGVPVSPVAPLSGYQPGRSMLFSWQAVTGAAGYRFERRGADGSVDERVATTGTAWAPLTAVPDGSHGWRVVALDAAGQDLAASGWQGFTVDGTAPTVTAQATTVKPGQDLRITFSERVRGVSTGTVRLFQKGEQHPLVTTVRLAATGRSAVIDPKAQLRVGRTYYLRITPGIRDAAGNPLAPVSWTVVARR